MAETSIEWTDYTFNPWIGCAKVSPGCQHCYAERMANHRSNWGATWGLKGSRVRTSPATWNNPLKWNQESLKSKRRLRVFCASLADVFEDRDDLSVYRSDLFQLIRKTPALDWLLLTKRPEKIHIMLPENWGQGWDNVWLGTSAEDQMRYDLRVEMLLSVPAKVHFVSAEPLLGPIKLRHGPKEGLDWIIVGGESGPNFREMKTEWACSVRKDCRRLGVAFFFKQHSAYQPKSKGNALDGRVYHNWPVAQKGKRGRPKTSPFSRQEQLKLAQHRFRKNHPSIVISKDLIDSVDRTVGASQRTKFVEHAIGALLKKQLPNKAQKSSR